MLKHLSFFGAIFVAFILCSCVETAIIGGTSTGILYSRHKSIDDTKSDIAIASKLAGKLLINGLTTANNFVDTTISEGRVLLTGMVTSNDNAKLAQDLAWKIDGVHEVIDELHICENCKLSANGMAKSVIDGFITGEVETALLFAKKVKSFNFTANTVDKTVYILGIANDEAEMNLVLKITSKIKGVKKVVNHIILADDVRRKQE